MPSITILLFVVIIQLALVIVILRIIMYDIRKVAESMPRDHLVSMRAFWCQYKITLDRFARLYEKFYLDDKNQAECTQITEL